MKRFLIVKTSSLGDIVHAFPVVSYLKEKFPSCEIDWIVEEPFSALVAAHPDIAEVIKVQTKKWRRTPFSPSTRQEFRRFKRQLKHYDIIFDLQGNLKSGFLSRWAKGKQRVGFGWKSVPEKTNLIFTQYQYDPPPGQNIRLDYLSIVQQHFQDEDPFHIKGIKLVSDFDPSCFLSGSDQNIMVCPGAHWENKCLPKESLLAALPVDAHFLITWGNEEEKKTALWLSSRLRDATLVPRLPFADLQTLMTAVDLVVAMDSFPLHLAATTETPTLSFFGPSSSNKYRPIGDHHRTFQGPCPYGMIFSKRCPKLRTCKTGACLKSDGVANRVKEIP